MRRSDTGQMRSLMSFVRISPRSRVPGVPRVPRVPGVLGFVVMVVVSAGAQTTPDLSGEWVMASLDAAVDVPRELHVTVRTESGSQVMRVERRGLSGTRSTEHRIGIEGGFVTGTRQTRSSARWIGQQLVIREGSYAGPLGENAPFTESEEVWSLDSSGRLEVRLTTRRQNVEPKTVQTFYRRR